MEAARQAYFDYLTASSTTPGAKAAAYDNAVKLLGESINAALESPSLDAGTRAALEGLLGEIDSGETVGDNVNSDVSLKDSLQLDGYVILESKPAEVANAEWENRGYDKDRHSLLDKQPVICRAISHCCSMVNSITLPNHLSSNIRTKR